MKINMNNVDDSEKMWALVILIIAIGIILGCVKGCDYTENTNQSAIEHGLVPNNWKPK